MRVLLAVLAMAVVLFPLTAKAIDVWGDQWGTWTRENSPYNVIGEIRVPPESTLVIEPGILVNFQGHYKFIVDSLATLLAVGTEADSIYFTPEDTATGWHGIRFTGASANSQISYCRLEYGKAIGSWPHPDAGGGAIYCGYSSPIITDNTIIDNWAEGAGGGIYCKYSSPEIRNNTITDNWAAHGGGIACHHDSNPTISGNTISSNLADGNGGGIYCRDHSDPIISRNLIIANSSIIGGGIYCRDYCDPQIIGNTISGNSSDWSGGGIYCSFYSRALISDNVICGNLAIYGGGILCSGQSETMINGNTIQGNSATYGGGIYAGDYSPASITNNIISANSAGSGGGIYCDFSSPQISNNTISSNWAMCFGGGIYCHRSGPTITNTILWADRAWEHPEIAVGGGNRPTVTYSDVQGGWPGRGNIDADPIFVGAERADFHLRWHSPCIDAGYPDSLDPDGTRSDIGAFYFNQGVDGIVELYPRNTPIVIPPEGGDITYDGWAFNISNNSLTVDIRGYLYLEGVGRYHRVHKHKNVSIPVGDSVGQNSIVNTVPSFFPAGHYTLVAYIGDYPMREIVDSCYFYFSKAGSVGDGIAGWFEGDEWRKESDLAESNLPSAYALSQNYPNPFNATAIIDFQLPVDGYVKLEVYNTLGQRVATLVDGRQGAGYKSVSWDASSVSSGLYFYRFSAGDYTETRRMMLVK